jgi:cytochrome c peroxidase
LVIGRAVLVHLANALILTRAAAAATVAVTPPPAAFSLSLPAGFPFPRIPADNPMSAAKVALGRRLFYDVRLSGNATQSCASCHQQARAFTDGRAHALGSTGQAHPRSAMSLANVAYSASLTWADPRVQSLESQAQIPMTNRHPVEMGMSGHEREVVARIRRDPLYASLFREAFPAGRAAVTLRNARQAIASFERTIVSGNSPYDRFVWQDDRSGMSDSALRGMTLFFSDRIRCSRCHEGFTFGSPAVWKGGPDARPVFFDNALGKRSGDTDLGLFQATRRPADRGRFRAPTLRNVSVTAPYMHDGRFATLGDVIDHYARGGVPRSGRSPFVVGFSMTQQEKADLLAFLESLTDEKLLSDACLSDPWRESAPPCPSEGQRTAPEAKGTKGPKTRTKP